jgi:hypothetical protein
MDAGRDDETPPGASGRFESLGLLRGGRRRAAAPAGRRVGLIRGRYLRFPGLEARRVALMLTRRELAGKAGMGYKVVHGLERGGMAELSSIRRLLRALGLPLDADLGPPGQGEVGP